MWQIILLTGERPFQCPMCPKRFPSSGAMKKHSRMHTGERPYECAEVFIKLMITMVSFNINDLCMFPTVSCKICRKRNAKSPRANAHWQQTTLVPVLRQKFHSSIAAACSHLPPYRREWIYVWALRQSVQQACPACDARQVCPWRSQAVRMWNVQEDFRPQRRSGSTQYLT